MKGAFSMDIILVWNAAHKSIKPRVKGGTLALAGHKKRADSTEPALHFY